MPQFIQKRVGLKTALLALILALSFQRTTAQTEETLQVGGGTIHIRLPTDLPLPRDEIIGWVRRAAVAVSDYLGRFPARDLSLTISGDGHGPVSDGVTYGASRIEVRLGRHVTEADLRQDWVMTHEMFHLAFPTLERRYLWMNEGLSDYLEPIARARVGQLTPEQVWRDMVEGMPQGLPEAGDEGLDRTHTWGRTYWGGDLYWLLADVRIRLQTHNQHTLRDAIRAILRDGGNGGADWTIEQVLSVGDKATGVTVLKDLHDELGLRPGQIDLSHLWRQLGVQYRRHEVHFDDRAPWAAIRASITAP